MDKAAIEVIARELTDEQWNSVMAWSSRKHRLTTDQAQALLAYLDAVWAGLTKAQRRVLGEIAEGYSASGERWSTSVVVRLRTQHLLLNGTNRYAPAPSNVTPLGRAVLKRAKERGR